MRHRPRGLRRFAGAALSPWSDATSSPPPAFAFASRVACGAALRGGSAALPPHRVAHLAVHLAQHVRVHRVERRDHDVRPAPPTMPALIRTPVPIMMPPVMMAAVHPLPTTAIPLMMRSMPPMVPMMVSGVPDGSVSPGASLRDRATLPSPLRGLGPSGGYPSRLRSLRSLRAPLAAAARCAHRRCRSDTLLPRFDSVVEVTAVSSSRRARLGSPRHSVRCRRRAAHDPVQHPRRSRPLNRRGGSDQPLSPAAISPSLMLHAWPFPTARGGLGSHTRRINDASLPPLRTGAMGRPSGVNNHSPSMPRRAGTSAIILRARDYGDYPHGFRE